MTFNQAKATGLPMRRAAWVNKWFRLWRGVWWWQQRSASRPVRTTDYADVDLLASDWTTIPAALTGCPIGGGGKPPPDAPPDIPGDCLTNGWFNSGLGGSGGSTVFDDLPKCATIIPAPFPPGTIEVKFSGLVVASVGSVSSVGLNGTYAIRRVSINFWESLFLSGTYTPASTPLQLQWAIQVLRTGTPPYDFTVTMLNNSAPPEHPAVMTGGFDGTGPRGTAIANENTTENVKLGTATVLG